MSERGSVDLSVVIVSYNTRDLLRETIAAVLPESRSIALEVIVVDNASSDGSAAMVAREFPAVRLIANPENRFYVGGNNHGLSIAYGRYLLILNPDARPEPGTLVEMVAWMDGHPRAGVLSPLMTFSDGAVQRNCATHLSFRQLLLEHTFIGLLRPRARRTTVREYWYGDWDRTTPRMVDVVPGSCMLVRRDAVADVGVLNERLVMYFTEDDWCLRMTRAGWQVAYAPIGRVVHDESASVRTRQRAMRRLYFRDMVEYVRAHHGRGRARLLFALSEPTRWALDLAQALRSLRDGGRRT